MLGAAPIASLDKGKAGELRRQVREIAAASESRREDPAIAISGCYRIRDRITSTR